MRKVILKMHVSLDGFVGAQDGDVDWLFPHFDEKMGEWEVEGLWEAGVHVMGRVLYGDMARHWPSSEEPTAPPMNDIPKVVFSQSLERAEWTDTRIERRPLVEGVTALREEPGKPILVHGGASFARALSREGLIDEYRLLVHPITLGEGLRPFDSRVDLQLEKVSRFPAGAVALTYSRT